MTVSDICRRGEMVGHASMSSFVFGVFEIIGMISIVIYVRYADINARRGQMNSLVLPIYYMIVVYEIAIGLLVGFDSVVGLYYDNIYARGVKWFLFQSVSEGLAVLFLHNGVGIRAFRNASVCGLVWGIVSAWLPIIVYHTVSYEAYCGVVITFLSLLLAFYLCCWLLPQRYLHRRPALVHLSRFYIIIISIFLVGYLISLSTQGGANCVVELTFAIADFFLPFIVLRALREDSRFWQGLYENAAASNLNQPLMGMWDFNQKTLTMVTDSICTLERKVVTIIPFGMLTLDTSRYFSGGSARVYRGQYRNHQVAIKMLFCIELTPERVIEFCNEASLLHSLQHPYVVTCHGVSVMPPAMCLVTEFCDVGSLYDFLHSEEPAEPTAEQASGTPQSAANSTASKASSRRLVDDSMNGMMRLVSSISNVSNNSSSQAQDIEFSNSELNANPLLQAARRPSDASAVNGISGETRRSLTQRPSDIVPTFNGLNSAFSDVEAGNGSANSDSKQNSKWASNSQGTTSSYSHNDHLRTISNSNNVSASGNHLTMASPAPNTTNRDSLTTPVSAMESSGSFMREFLGMPSSSDGGRQSIDAANSMRRRTTSLMQLPQVSNDTPA
jgi:hypothetical protein